ncbi:MAG: uncharacterized membrane protein YjjP (DUF1212 family) [Flavobacterium sp.]|jgi:uncharacterized membrane protein YjjP (DUF1212 family)
MEIVVKVNEKEINQTLNILAEVVVALHSSGAHYARIVRNVERMAKGLGYDVDLVLTFNGIVITINKDKSSYTLSRSIKVKGINFETVSGISILSWDVLENKISTRRIGKILNRIKRKTVYNKGALYFFIPLASMALCRLFEGDWFQCIIAFISTLLGFSFLKVLRTKNYNSFFSYFLVTVVSVSTIHLLGALLNLNNVQVLAVSVLYLVPGVFLINSFIDYLEGYIEAGSSKLIYGLFIIFSIACGFFFSNFMFEQGFFNHVLVDLSKAQQSNVFYGQSSFPLLLASKFLWGGITSLGFAVLFNTPKRALWVVFLLGGIGYMIKYYLNVEINFSQLFAVFCASCFVGLSGMYFAHRTHTPPVVFTIPAVINMIPGLLSYKFMMGLIKWTMQPNRETQNINEVIEIFNTGVSAIFIVFALAFGVAFGVIVFKSHSVKGKNLNRLINLYFIKYPEKNTKL